MELLLPAEVPYFEGNPGRAPTGTMIVRHPKTTFILLHVGNWPENLDYVEQSLKRFPNTVVEFGAREAELGRQPRRAREMFLKYPDRVLFRDRHGADGAALPQLFPLARDGE